MLFLLQSCLQHNYFLFFAVILGTVSINYHLYPNPQKLVLLHVVTHTHTTSEKKHNARAVLGDLSTLVAFIILDDRRHWGKHMTNWKTFFILQLQSINKFFFSTRCLSLFAHQGTRLYGTCQPCVHRRPYSKDSRIFAFSISVIDTNIE